MDETLPEEGADEASAGPAPSTPPQTETQGAGVVAEGATVPIEPTNAPAVGDGGRLGAALDESPQVAGDILQTRNETGAPSDATQPAANGVAVPGDAEHTAADAAASGDATQPRADAAAAPGEASLSADAAQGPVSAAPGLQAPVWPPSPDPAAGDMSSPGLLGFGGLDGSPYGLMALWGQSDWVIKGVAATLLLMSILSWYLILTRSLRGMGLKRAARRARHFWHAETFAEGLELLGRRERGNPFRHLAEEGAHARDHHAARRQELHGQLSLSDWLTTSLRAAIDESAERMQSGLSILASIGSTAPFIGLFGTVWGIYHALVNIGVSGQASIDKVAGPVGEALVMTAFGLAVAIPAVLAYNMLVRTNKGVVSQLNRFAHQLHAYFLTGSPVSRPELRLASIKREAG